MSTYKLTYFNVKGLGEPIRMLFHAAEQEFEDKRIEIEDWPNVKDTFPTKKLPILETPDGKVLRESMAICRYIALKNNLYTTDPEEIYRIELPIGILADLLKTVASMHYMKNEEEKAKELEDFRETNGPRLLDQLQVLLDESTTGFIADTAKPNLADIFFTAMMDFMVEKHDDLLAKYPKLVEHKEKIIAHFPKLTDYMKNRPQAKY